MDADFLAPELGEGRVRTQYLEYVKIRYGNPDLNELPRLLRVQYQLAAGFDPEQKAYFSVLCNEFDRHAATATREADRSDRDDFRVDV